MPDHPWYDSHNLFIFDIRPCHCICFSWSSLTISEHCSIKSLKDRFYNLKSGILKYFFLACVHVKYSIKIKLQSRLWNSWRFGSLSSVRHWNGLFIFKFWRNFHSSWACLFYLSFIYWSESAYNLYISRCVSLLRQILKLLRFIIIILSWFRA